MTIVSSLRPFDEHKAYAEMQKKAYQSWKAILANVIYLGESEPSLKDATFVASENFPQVRKAALILATEHDLGILANADITLTPEIIKVMRDMMQARCRVAVSKRYSEKTGQVMDNGLDVIVAMPDVWREVARMMPAQFRFSNLRWDGWILGMLGSVYRETFRDFTAYKCVFHPEHGDRRAPLASGDPVGDNYEKTARWPMPL